MSELLKELRDLTGRSVREIEDIAERGVAEFRSTGDRRFASQFGEELFEAKAPVFLKCLEGSDFAGMQRLIYVERLALGLMFASTGNDPKRFRTEFGGLGVDWNSDSIRKMLGGGWNLDDLI